MDIFVTSFLRNLAVRKRKRSVYFHTIISNEVSVSLIIQLIKPYTNKIKINFNSTHSAFHPE